MNKIKLFFAGVLVALISSSCTPFDETMCTRGSGDIVEEPRDLIEDFSAISLEMAADVVFVQSEEYSLTVETYDNLHDMIVTRVRNGDLVLRTRRSECIRGNGRVTFYVSAPNLDDIVLAGSGNIYCDQLNTEQLRVVISGSGSIELEDLMADQLETIITGSGNIRIGGSEIIAEGHANITGSGNLMATDLPFSTFKADIAGSGGCEIWVEDELDVNITGSGSVRYKGNPAVNTRITGSGDVKKL